MNEETIDYRKLAEALAEALEQRNLWIEGEGYRELVILRMRLSARVDSLAEELKVANARIAELEAECRWIPVSERLPEKQKLTIGFTDNSAYVFFEIVNDDEMGLVMYPYQNRKGTVTHWMPLPSTPEVQE